MLKGGLILIWELYTNLVLTLLHMHFMKFESMTDTNAYSTAQWVHYGRYGNIKGLSNGIIDPSPTNLPTQTQVTYPPTCPSLSPYSGGGPSAIIITKMWLKKSHIYM